MQPFLRPLESSQEAICILQCKQGNQQARQMLIEHNLRLVAHIVKKYQGKERDVEDLISIGTIGLIKAIDTYDGTKGNRLATYAARCIENELLMMLRQEKKKSREVSVYEPIGQDREGNEIRLLDIIESIDEDVVESMTLDERKKNLYLLLEERLEQREKELIVLRYGLLGNVVHTQKSLGEKYGISRSYVSRLEKKALKKLLAGYENR